MARRISDFDVSEYLGDDASIAAYLSEVVAQDDPKLLLAAIGDIAKARGMGKIASDAGLGRESLYKALNSGAKPRFGTVLKVLGALGLKISFTARAPKRRAGGKPVRSRASRSTRGPVTA